MRSRVNRPTPEAFALALLLASSLQIMENLVPRVPIFPWLKLGLSYVIIVPFLLRYGAVPAFALLVGRNLLGVLYGGQMFSTFLISTGSGAVAFLVLGLPVAWLFHRKIFGLAGISILLATAFNLSQLFLVERILIRHSGFFFQVGPILVWSVVSALVVAYLIRLSEADLEGAWDRESDTGPTAFGVLPQPDSGSALPHPQTRGTHALFAASLLLAGFVLGVSSPVLQASILAVALPVSARVFGMRSRATFKMLLASWPLFFYLAWLHLFHTPGRLWVLGMTREGVTAFALHGLRLLNLVVIGRWLAQTLPLAWMQRSSRPYFRGFLLAVPLLPGLFSFSVAAGRQIAKRWLGGERANLLTPLFDAWKRNLTGQPGSADRG